MKKIGILLVLIFSVNIVFGQESDTDRKEARKARKEEQKRIAMENSERLKAIIESKQFVLEAHTLFGKGGVTFNLSPTTNFVGIDGENSTIQLAFNNLVGWNGVGGVTLDGRVTKLEIKGKEDKPNFNVNVNVINNAGGMVTMIFRISSDGNARVDMTGTFGERLSYQGRIVRLSESRVYKGWTRF